jgi:hypothetical protein
MVPVKDAVQPVANQARQVYDLAIARQDFAALDDFNRRLQVRR